MSAPADPSGQRARQRKTLLIRGFARVAGGLVILIALQRMPAPLRILVGLTDIVAGLTLLIVVRQKF